MKWPRQHYDLVLVLWDDAAGFRHGWTAKEEELTPQLAMSVGFVIRESQDHILIAQDTDGDGSHNGRSQIPRAMVKNMKVLKRATKPRAPEAQGSKNEHRPEAV